jgi:16S rRNA (cytidine1402-2'-O)-methyltransferase
MRLDRIELAETLEPGVLYIVATPIGNLQDISLRALLVLEGVDLVAAEDTRHTGILLKAYGLKKNLMCCFAHNEEKQSRRIIAFLQEGGTVALVSDAGMPGISDPGSRLVRQAVKAGVKLTVIPGPSAGVAALAASGLDTAAFAFGGFIPRDAKGRKAWFKRFGGFTGTLIVYESPRRLQETLLMLKEAWGDRYCCIARELTKRYEEFIRGGLTEVAGKVVEAGGLKGEVVIVLEGCPEPDGKSFSPEEAEEWGKALLAEGMGKKEASRRLAEKTGLSAKASYAMLLEWDR